MVSHGYFAPVRRLPGDHTTMSLLRAAALTVLALLLNACGGGGGWRGQYASRHPLTAAAPR
ncbi:MAG: hypothetical protein ACO2YP_06870, partial [Pseudomonadales bacterium]